MIMSSNIGITIIMGTGWALGCKPPLVLISRSTPQPLSYQNLLLLLIYDFYHRMRDAYILNFPIKDKCQNTAPSLSLKVVHTISILLTL